MKRMNGWTSSACTAALAAAFLLAAPGAAQAPADKGGDKALHVEEQDGVAAVLKRLEGRPVKLRLAGGGEEISGKIVKVGKELVHLSDLTGRDFYDGVVRIDQIAAVVVQVRGR